MNNMKIITIYTLFIGFAWLFTQAAWGQQSDSVQPPPATTVEGPQKTAGGVSASEVANANNPLAPMNAVFFQNYYAPTSYGVPGSGNSLDFRPVVVNGRQIIRTTFPISSGEDSDGNQQSGLGDISVFDAIRVTPEQSKNVLAMGPLLVAPTATNRSLGQGKWQAGFAAFGVHLLSPGSEVIGILT